MPLKDYFIGYMILVLAIEIVNTVLSQNGKKFIPFNLFDRSVVSFFYLFQFYESINRQIMQIIRVTPKLGWFWKINFYPSIKPGTLSGMALAYLSFILFFIAYFFIIRYPVLPFSYFVRYHIMQAFLSSMVFELGLATIQLTIAHGDPLTNPIIQYISDPLTTFVLLGYGAFLSYCTYIALKGQFTYIPIINEAVQVHVGKRPK
jgi:hypothetical protein